MSKLPNIIEHDRTVWKTLGFVLRESFKGSKKYSIISYVAAALTAAFVVAQFGVFGMIVNEFVVHGIEGARTVVLVKAFILLMITQFGPDIINTVYEYTTSVQMDDLSRHLQSLMFKKIDSLDIGTIEQPEFQNIKEISGNRAWNSFYNIVNLFAFAFRSISRLVFSAIVILSISPGAFFVIFAGALPTYYFERKNAKLSAKIHKENSDSWRIWRIKGDIIDSKHMLIEAKNFSLVEVFRKKFIMIITNIHNQLKDMRKGKMFGEFAAQTILGLSFGITFAMLINGVFVGKIAIGALVFSFGVVTQFQMAINQLLSQFGRMIEHKKNVDTFMDLLEMEPMIVSGSIRIRSEDFRTIELRDVSFTYPGANKDVLKSINFIFSKGDNIAIVGLNGAGKSTLLKLLTRVYDPTSGEILVNGINLKEYDTESWKQCLGILLQEYELYEEETIAENIMLGDSLKHDNNIMTQSAQDTTADEFVNELPDMYQQKIGTEFQGGVELSKGQKQKLALARTLYRNAPIIILDEPTASVDALSESKIFKAIHENHKDQTRIIISHKFSNVRDADKIILIEHGTIIEQGSHDQLMKKKKGKYKELFELQAEGYK